MARADKTALTVSGVMCRKKPEYGPLAAALLQDMQAFFSTQEGEAEFQAWLRDPDAVRRAWDEKARDGQCA